jgi:hypothetical protein
VFSEVAVPKWGAVLVTLISLAAPASALTIRPGIEVGASYNTFVHGSTAGPYASDWSWHPTVGLLLEAEFPRRIRLGSGIRWEQGGAPTHADGVYVHDSNQARESWLTADLSIQSRPRFGIRATLAAEAAYLLSGQVSGHFVSPSGDQPYVQDYGEEGKRGDLRVKVGIAQEFPVGSRRVAWALRFVEGLASLERPTYYLGANPRDIPWTATSNYLPDGASRVRAVETGLTLYW